MVYFLKLWFPSGVKIVPTTSVDVLFMKEWKRSPLNLQLCYSLLCHLLIRHYPVKTSRFKDVLKTSFVCYGCLKDVSGTSLSIWVWGTEKKINRIRLILQSKISLICGFKRNLIWWYYCYVVSSSLSWST